MGREPCYQVILSSSSRLKCIIRLSRPGAAGSTCNTNMFAMLAAILAEILTTMLTAMLTAIIATMLTTVLTTMLTALLTALLTAMRASVTNNQYTMLVASAPSHCQSCPCFPLLTRPTVAESACNDSMHAMLTCHSPPSYQARSCCSQHHHTASQVYVVYDLSLLPMLCMTLRHGNRHHTGN